MWMLPSTVFAQAIKKSPPNGYRVTDENADGWDDRWLESFPRIDKTKPWNDSNGDGTPDLFEMFLNRDPFQPFVKAPQKQPWEIAREKRKVAERRRTAYEDRRAILEPFINKGLQNAKGEPIMSSLSR